MLHLDTVDNPVIGFDSVQPDSNANISAPFTLMDLGFGIT